MRVIELFSGIGGMHFALKESGITGQVVRAVDINNVANNVYGVNFPETEILQRNIQMLSGKDLQELSPEMILMSPPCQPFTRVGLKKDILDYRSEALLHIIKVLPELGEQFRYLLMENVKGFETSEARSQLIDRLKEIGFSCQEFILSPKCVGTPNVRNRYYLLAKRLPFTFTPTQSIMEKLPNIDGTSGPEAECITISISDVLEIPDDSKKYQEFSIPDTVLLRRAKVLDVVTKDSKTSCCFTKAYTHYAEGTGSVYCPYNSETIKTVFECEKLEETMLRGLKLRYFTPKEISRLMNFPDEFSFPEGVTRKQKYRLLGNSVNVKVVASLIRLMCE